MLATFPLCPRKSPEHAKVQCGEAYFDALTEGITHTHRRPPGRKQDCRSHDVACVSLLWGRHLSSYIRFHGNPSKGVDIPSHISHSIWSMPPEKSPQHNGIDPHSWYSVGEATAFLKSGSISVTPETVKRYCRKKKLVAKRFGPRQAWMVKGRSLAQLRAKWGIDELAG